MTVKQLLVSRGFWVFIFIFVMLDIASFFMVSGWGFVWVILATIGAIGGHILSTWINNKIIEL